MKTDIKELEQLKDKTFVLHLTISKENLLKEYQEVLKAFQKNFTKKGFRQGNVPLNIVESELDQNQAYSEILSHLLSHLYQDKVKEYGLRPVIDPQIKITNPPLTLDKDWLVDVTAAELPQIELDKNLYQKIAKNNSSTDLIIKTLLENTKVTLPQILIESDVQKNLSRMVDQIESAGMKVEDYLKSKNETSKSYQEKIEKQVKEEWTINLAINQISINEKIQVESKDAEEIFKKQPEMKNNPELVFYLLTQQKVIDFLKNLK